MWTDWAVAAMTSTANGKTSQTGHGSRNWCAPPCDIAMAATGTARSSWIGSLRRAGMPSEPTRSLLRSSAKPMTPPATSPATAGHAPECPASAASNPPTRPRIPKRMPPPVGVPAFFWWLSGSSFVGHEVGVRSDGEHAAQLAVENCDGVEHLGGLAAGAPVRLDSQRTELAHGTEHREQPALARPLSQSFKRSQHRLGAGVVSVVDDHDAV